METHAITVFNTANRFSR